MGTVHFDFGEEGKAHAVMGFAECADLGFRARLLRAKLVAGEAQNLEAPLPVSAIELFEARVLRGKSARRGELAVFTISRTRLRNLSRLTGFPSSRAAENP